MKITDIETILIEIKLEPPLWNMYTAMRTLYEVIVKVKTDDGIVGLGMGSNRDYRNVKRVLEESLKPIIVGEDPFDIDRLWWKMFDTTYERDWNSHGWGRPQIMAAIAAVDVALWDIKGKATNKTVAQLLGGYRTRVPVYAGGGHYAEGKDIRALVEEMEGYRKMGLRYLKMKVGGLGIAGDCERLKAVRDNLGWDFNLLLDFNRGFRSIDQSIEMLHAFEEFKPFWFEEPVPWYETPFGVRKVAASTSVPIADGEQEITHYGARDMIENGGIKVMQYDPTVGGGVTEWLRVAATAEAHNVTMAPHQDPHLGVHMVAGVKNGLLVEAFPNPKRDLWWFTLYSERAEIDNEGYIVVPDRPGFGYAFNDKVVEQYRVR
ncbi:MAG: mandelate racemase/muconate lactonizing enzyme family protein [Chloroflexi bacterium]|nr:mandelate racemase/muconate lactonizing enzyme family protein [Chloroflexota bacterium]